MRPQQNKNGPHAVDALGDFSARRGSGRGGSSGQVCRFLGRTRRGGKARARPGQKKRQDGGATKGNCGQERTSAESPVLPTARTFENCPNGQTACRLRRLLLLASSPQQAILLQGRPQRVPVSGWRGERGECPAGGQARWGWRVCRRGRQEKGRGWQRKTFGPEDDGDNRERETKWAVGFQRQNTDTERPTANRQRYKKADDVAAGRRVLVDARLVDGDDLSTGLGAWKSGRTSSVFRIRTEDNTEDTEGTEVPSFASLSLVSHVAGLATPREAIAVRCSSLQFGAACCSSVQPVALSSCPSSPP